MADSDGLDYGILDRAGAAEWIFYPRPDRRPPPAGASDHMIDVGHGVEVAARFYPSSPSLPSILYFHGNGEIASDHDEIAPLYHEAGANLFVAEFRGYGKSSGRPSVRHLVGDAHPCAERFHAILDEGGFDARRFVMGRSLGTHPALEVAARLRGFRGLIVESGAGAIQRMLGRVGLGGNAEGEALASAHDAKIRSIRMPALLIHGETDDLVPLDYAAELYDLLAGTERELLVIPGAGHNDILWVGMRQYFEAIRKFIAR